VPSLIKTYGGGSRDVEISFSKARKSFAARQEDGLDYREVIGSTSGAVKHLIRHIGDMYSREINSVTYKRHRAAGLDQSLPLSAIVITGKCKAELTQLHAISLRDRPKKVCR